MEAFERPERARVQAPCILRMGSMTPSIRTVAVTQSDPFFTGRFFETFLPTAREKGVEVVEIALLPNFNESRPALVRRLASLYGPAGLIRLVGRYAGARLDERRGRPRGVEAVATANGVALRPLATINDPSYLATLRERSVDVLLSVAAPQIFGSEALAATPLALNVHNGRLPDYRGMMPTFWALLYGEERVVVTVHEMAERLDAGAVLAEFDVPVAPGDSAFDVARNAKAVAGREVAGLLATARAEHWPAPRAIDVGRGRYHGFPTRTDARRLRERGRRML
jgi:methionyl-tRNA formyltransferase